MTHLQSSLAIASDHAGFELKSALLAVLGETGRVIVDVGTHSAESVDYPDIANALAEVIGSGRALQGIAMCGSGIGIAIALNRHRFIRAAVCHDVTSARLARLHNDANVLVLGARLIGSDVARDCVDVFLRTAFEGGRHARRVGKLG